MSIALITTACSTDQGTSGAQEILRDLRSSEEAGQTRDPDQSTANEELATGSMQSDEKLEALQAKAFAELKRAQEPYSARQNRLACAYMVTNPSKARELHTSDSPLTWEEFVDPLLASCWEWIEGMSEPEMQALVIYENEVAPDIFGICDNYRQIGRSETRKAMKEWLELNGEPASLAGKITALIVRECKNR